MATTEPERWAPLPFDPREWRCMAPACPHGWPILDGRPMWSISWLEQSPAGHRTHCGRDFCSLECRDRGRAAAIPVAGELIPDTYGESEWVPDGTEE